jgi:hypothetical protein
MTYFNHEDVIISYIKRLESIQFLKGNSYRQEKVRKELKKLLIELKDAINLESGTDADNIQVEKAKEIWIILLSNSLAQISKSRNVRGLSAIIEYFNEMEKFEDVLFSIEKFYRDHTIHALWVYLLGDYVFNHKKYRWLLSSGIDWDIKSFKKINKKVVLKFEKKLMNYKDAIYCITSLCHDLAYPFEKAHKINSRIEQLGGYIGINSFERLNVGFATEQLFLMQELLNLCSQKIVFQKNNEVELIRDDPTLVDLSHSLEQHKHGILSAYILYRLVDTMGEVTFSNIKQRYEGKEQLDVAQQSLIRSAILHAIASHTSDYAYSSKYNTFRFFLSLFDELEEFSRYSRRGRSSINETCKSELQLEDVGCFTAIYCLIDDTQEKIFKQFCLRRAERFIRMINVDADENADNRIKKFKMICKNGSVKTKSSDSQQKLELIIDNKGVFLKYNTKNYVELSPNTEYRLREILNPINN